MSERIALPAWNDVWFRPASPLGLVALRSVAAAQALWIVLSRPDLPDLVAWPAEFWRAVPPGVAVRFGFLGLPPAGEWALYALLHLALAATLLGVVPRASGLLAGLLLYHFAPLDEINTGLFHVFFSGLTFPLLALLVLSFAEAPRLSAPASPEFRWPLVLARFLLAMNYFCAGVAKLVWAGPAWFTGESLRGILLTSWSFDGSPLALWLASEDALCWALVVATALLEFLFPLAVVSERAGLALAALAVLFHAGIALSLGLVFLSLPSLVIYLDWDQIDAWRKRRRDARARPVLASEALLATLALAAPACADPAGAAAPDWPRLWGAEGAARSDGPLPLDATVRLREVWRRRVGSGYSSVSAVGDRGFTAESDGTDDHLLSFDLATGRTLWRSRLGPTYRGHDGSRDGPSSTPTLDAGRAFVVGPHGTLHALDAATGRELWSHDLRARYGAVAPGWGFATSPLVVGELLIVQAGGATHNLIAFDKANGALRWAASHSTTSGYASPLHGTLAGHAQVVVCANDKMFAVDPADGSLLWAVDVETAHEATRPPALLPGDRVLLPLREETRLYRIGKQGARLKARLQWRSPRLRASYSPVVWHRGFLFGFNDTFAVCLDPRDGTLRWRERMGWGAAILVDGTLVLLAAKTGELRLARASPHAYQERARTGVFTDGLYAPTTPAYAGGLILLRKLTEMVALAAR